MKVSVCIWSELSLEDLAHFINEDEDLTPEAVARFLEQLLGHLKEWAWKPEALAQLDKAYAAFRKGVNQPQF